MHDPPGRPKRSADDEWRRIRAWIEFLLSGVVAAALCNAVLGLSGYLNAQVDRSELLRLGAAAGVVVIAGAVLLYVGRFSLDGSRPWVPVAAGALIGALSAIGSATFQAALLYYG
jgi:hypothetical protein